MMPARISFFGPTASHAENLWPPRRPPSNSNIHPVGYIESFNARLRDELLDGEIFYHAARGSDHYRELAAPLQRRATACFA